VASVGVVDDDDLVGRAVLGEHLLDDLAELVGAVVRDDDSGHVGHEAHLS
jgi:hypothetical protein